MVWYPTPEDVISSNKIVMRSDKHRHRLLRSIGAIQAKIDAIQESEHMGLTYQAARFMQDLTVLHAFDGGNHRTAYAITSLFLIQNGMTVNIVRADISYSFVKNIAKKEVQEVQKWIERHLV